MKIIFKTALMAVTILFCGAIQAQEAPFTVGVKAGVSMSSLAGDPDGDSKIGFIAGVTLELPLSVNNLYLLTGLDYSLQGGKSGVYKLDISYLQVPVHAVYKFNNWEEMTFILHAGPYIGYAIDGKWKHKDSNIDAFSSKAELLAPGRLKKFDFGIGAGAGIEVGRIGVDVGYDFGLANISDQKSTTIRNMNVRLAIGYQF